MSEENSETLEKEPEVKQEVQPEDEFDKDRAMATIKKLRGIENEATKENKELKAQLERFEQAEKERKEAEMSETEKLKADLEAEKAEREKLQSFIEEQKAQREKEQMQLEAAKAVELPLEFADRIRGETKEEMEADAKKLLDAMPAKPKPRVTATNPQGGSGSEGGETDTERRRRLGL